MNNVKKFFLSSILIVATLFCLLNLYNITTISLYKEVGYLSNSNWSSVFKLLAMQVIPFCGLLVSTIFIVDKFHIELNKMLTKSKHLEYCFKLYNEDNFFTFGLVNKTFLKKEAKKHPDSPQFQQYFHDIMKSYKLTKSSKFAYLTLTVYIPIIIISSFSSNFYLVLIRLLLLNNILFLFLFVFFLFDYKKICKEISVLNATF
jgi:hypothetical protein